MIYERCREILLKEIELVMQAASIQEKIRTAVLDGEWEGFEGHISEISAIEKKISALENERENLFDSFAGASSGEVDSKSRFYSIAEKLPQEQRDDLTAVYRCLKMETLKLRIANESYMTYLSAIKSTISDFFEAVFPERSGKMYTPQGTHHSNDMRSLVLNQSF